MTTKQFQKLSKAKKAVLVAKDVLEQLAAKKYRANTGNYISFDGQIPFEGDIKSNFDKLPSCKVCALGSMLLSCTKLGNVLTTDDIDTSVGHSDLTSSDNVRVLFDSIFSNKQLLLIETAFEGYNDWKYMSNSDEFKEYEKDFEYYQSADRYGDDETLSFEEASACTKFYMKYRKDVRLIAICNNIIENDGTFIP